MWYRVRGTIGTGAGILFIHGGGWSAGKKEQFHPLAEHFCKLGYTCASMSYRLSGHSKFPAQIEDARLGMAHLKQHACNISEIHR